MFRRTDETKVLRDPVHGYIHIDYEVIWKCVNNRWFQRLRRIRQLGGAYMVYHTADHTRFAHSLGVYEIVRRMVSEVPDISRALSEREKLTVMLAGLLHDIGHGPYSHAFEMVSEVFHEEYTCRIIEESEIAAILEEAAPGLSKDVADVIRHRSANPLLFQIVSSQLDADRMDYLLRDAYFTGTTYGEFDLERILRTLRVAEGVLAVKESGVYAVENYIMARYHMYWQVYYHPVARSYEAIMTRAFQRLRDLCAMGCAVDTVEELLLVGSGRKLNLEEFYRLDENACSYGFCMLSECPDPVLADLSRRLQDRDLFGYQENTPEAWAEMTERLMERGFDPEYYLAKDAVNQSPYIPYNREGGSAIWVRMHGGEVREISEASSLVKSLVKGPVLKDDRIYFPKEILKEEER